MEAAQVIKHDFAKADIVGALIAPSLCRASHIAACEEYCS